MIRRVEDRGEMAVSDEDFQRLLSAVDALSPAQIAVLAAALHGRPLPALPESSAPRSAGIPETPAAGAGSIDDIEARFAADPCCPSCQSKAIGKWGSANRLARYRCKACKLTFNALTG